MNQQEAIDFTQQWEYSDVVFAVEGKRMYASKMILSMWSPVIKAMLSRDFKEKNAQEIPLPGKTADAFIELMQVLHPPTKEIDGVCLFVWRSNRYYLPIYLSAN